jgi:guanosine-3',5'-bis(diphosphate) 3'-pyrophosphohydrolase
MTGLERAIEIAVKAHAGQVDKAGAPYVLHPLRVMLRVSGELDMMAAVLHDVVEDGPGWTFERLASEGIPAEVVEALSFLTKRPDEESDYSLFIRRAASNPIARRVKLADLEDNMDIGRIAHPTEKDLARTEKYRAAHALLTGYGTPGSNPGS